MQEEEIGSTKVADSGGFLAPYEKLRRDGLSLGFVPRTFREIRERLTEQLKKNPLAVFSEIFDLLLVADLELLLRNKLALDWLLDRNDQRASQGAPLVPPQAVELIERLSAQQESVLNLLSLRTRVTRQAEKSDLLDGTNQWPKRRQGRGSTGSSGASRNSSLFSENRVTSSRTATSGAAFGTG